MQEAVEKKAKKIIVITDPKADVDDIAAIYQLAITEGFEVSLVLGANKEISRDASEAYLNLEALKAHADSKGLTFTMPSIMTFESFMSAGSIECDHLLNISPWSALENLAENLQEKALGGCSHIHLSGVLAHQGTVFTGDRPGFNTGRFNQPFFERIRDEGRFMELNSALCAPGNGLMADAAYIEQMPDFVKEALFINSFTQMISRAPQQISQGGFSVLGLINSHAGGLGANYINTKKYYEAFIKASNTNVDFEALPLSDTARRVATDYVDSALIVINQRCLPSRHLTPAQREETIEKLARMNTAFEMAFGAELFEGGPIVGLSPTRDSYASSEILSLALAAFKEKPTVLTPLYDLQAVYMFKNKFLPHYETTRHMPEAISFATEALQLNQPRAAMMTELVSELKRGCELQATSSFLGGHGMFSPAVDNQQRADGGRDEPDSKRSCNKGSLS